MYSLMTNYGLYRRVLEYITLKTTDRLDVIPAAAPDET
jgi:hypothetical protein